MMLVSAQSLMQYLCKTATLLACQQKVFNTIHILYVRWYYGISKFIKKATVNFSTCIKMS
jgi:hypothetical protein